MSDKRYLNLIKKYISPSIYLFILYWVIDSLVEFYFSYDQFKFTECLMGGIPFNYIIDRILIGIILIIAFYMSAKKGRSIAYISEKHKELSRLYEDLTATEEELRAQNEEINEQKSALEKMHMELLWQKNFFEQLFLQSPAGMVIYDKEGWCVRVNPQFCKMFGVKPQDVEGRTVNILTDTESLRQGIFHQIRRVFEEGMCVEWEIPFDMKTALRIDDENTTVRNDAWLHCKSYPIYNNDGVLVHVIAQLEDISVTKKNEEEIRFLLNHDKLTRLYNHAFFENELHRFNKNEYLPITLVVGDVNGLKFFNDVFGFEEGDKLLVHIANLLVSIFPKNSIISRWGGDEFAILLPNTGDDKTAGYCSLFRQACESSEFSNMRPSLSFGFCTRLNLEQSVDEILKTAENRMYRHKLLENRSIRSSNILSLQKTLFERSYETEEHAMRLSELTSLIGAEAGLSQSMLDELKLFSILHDIGKIGISDSILMKPSKLLPEEWDEMKKHSSIGYRIAMSSPELSHIAEYILTHHEHWNGKGYPLGLTGNEIPLLSRILTIADAYDVMTHSRIYKNPISHEDALKEIERCSGTQFDPVLTDLFINLFKNKKII